MTDIQPPQPSASPTPATPEPANTGSLVLGVCIAWVIVVGGYALILMLAMAGVGFVDTIVSSASSALLPVAVAVVTAVVLMSSGKQRTGEGILLGVVSIFAVGQVGS